jgi:hypothetical protein
VYIQDGAYGIYQGVGVESWQNTLRNIYVNGYSIGGIHLKGGGTTWGLRDIYVQNISGPADYTETIVNVVRSSGTNLTITLSGAPPTLLTTNSFFVTSGLAPSAYNGGFVVTSIAGSVVTASMASDPGVAPSDVVGVLQAARQFSTEQPVYLGGGYYSVNGLDVEHCVTGSTSFIYLGSAWVDIQDLHIEGAYSTNSTFSHIRSQSVAASLGTVSVINSGFIPGQTGYTLYNDGSGQTNLLSVKSLSVRDVATNGATWIAALKSSGATDAILGNWNGIGSLRANTAGYPQSWGDVYKLWGYDWDEGVTATLARNFSVTGTIQGSSTIKAAGGIAAGGVSVSRDFTSTAYGMQVRGDTGDALAITSVGNLTYIKSDAADGLPSLYMDGINNLWSFSSPARWSSTNGVEIVSTNLSVFGTNIFTIIANSVGGGGGGGNVYHGSSSTNNYLTMFSGTSGTNIVQSDVSFVLGDGLYVGTGGANNIYGSAFHGVSLNLKNSLGDTYSAQIGAPGGAFTADRTISVQDQNGTLAFLTDNVASATVLATARNINGVSFNGSANIALPEYIYVDAGAMAPFATAGATAATTTLATTGFPSDEYAFDASTDEKVAFKMAMPDNWNGTTLTAKFVWRSTATTGNCVWTISARFARDGDNPDTTFGTAVSLTDGTAGTANYQNISSASGTITPSGTNGAGAMVYFILTRDADNGSDTLAVDALLQGVQINWQ